MKGFDPKFKNFPDYILGITYEIWEEKGLDKLHDYYADDLVVRSPGSIVEGNETVIEATRATLDEFPDRELLGEDVIWSGTPEEGMLSSHRILSRATHANDGVYGKATGKKLVYRVIADCHAINDQINDEWLVRDQGYIVRQLGWEPKEYAKDLIEREGGKQNCVQPFLPANDTPGPYTGRGNDNHWGQRYADILSRLMSKDSAVIRESYDRACNLEYPGGITAHSYNGAEAFWQGLLASFPDAQFSIEHQIGQEDQFMPPRAAIRFSLQGKHTGHGSFGEPTGADVYIMAIAHAEFGPWGLRREWVVFDETAIWKQILLQT